MLVLACALCGLLAVGDGGTGAIDGGNSTQLEVESRKSEVVEASTVPSSATDRASMPTSDTGLLFPGEERHLRNIRQLTFGHSPEFDHLPYPANYAEAYWSPDGRKLILQSTRDEYECDQMFVLDVITGGLELV
nr:hypothetical protein [bacterium]